MIPQVICAAVLSKVSARSSTVRETVKKSKASQVCRIAIRQRVAWRWETRERGFRSRDGYLIRLDRVWGIRLHTHAKKATPKKAQWWAVSIRSSRKGLGVLAMGGFKLVKRVRRYCPTDIP